MVHGTSRRLTDRVAMESAISDNNAQRFRLAAGSLLTSEPLSSALGDGDTLLVEAL